MAKTLREKLLAVWPDMSPDNEKRLLKIMRQHIILSILDNLTVRLYHFDLLKLESNEDIQLIVQLFTRSNYDNELIIDLQKNHAATDKLNLLIDILKLAIRKLSINDCFLHRDVIHTIANNHSISHLVLSNIEAALNDLFDTSALPKLKILDLQSCYVKNRHIPLIANFIQRRKIVSLSLQGNRDLSNIKD